MIRGWHMSDSAEVSYWHGTLITELWERCAAKDQTVGVAANEALIIHKGVTVTLKRGARIDGTVYVQKGGKLRVAGGDFSVSQMGAVLSDGIFSVGKNATFSVANGGEVFVGKTGKLSIANEKSLRFGDMATVVCVGKTNTENMRIGKNLIAAYLTKDGVTTLAESPEEELPSPEMYDNGYHISNPTIVTYVFDNGVCLRAIRDPWYDYIGKCRICIATEPAEDTSFSHINYTEVKIVNIDGVDCWETGEGYEPVPVLPVSSEFADPYDE